MLTYTTNTTNMRENIKIQKVIKKFRRCLGSEFHSREAALLKLDCPKAVLALTPSISELSLKLRSHSSERLTKYPFSCRGQSILLMILNTICNLKKRLLLLKESSVNFDLMCCVQVL